jgi:short-subunit dehydrogenase
MPFSLQNKVAIVTGASAGIGEAVSRRLAAQGVSVVLAARTLEPLENLARSIVAAGGKAIAVPTDVGSHEDQERLIKITLETYGQIDILVNNAGLHHRGLFENVAAMDLAKMVDVNLRGPLVLTHLALPHLRLGGGAVVNVASLAGHLPLPEAATYSSTKFGLRALSLALGLELAESGVTFSLVSPGPVSTGFIMDHLENVSHLTLSQPISTPDEIADDVLACIQDGEPERCRPANSGRLAKAAYVLPGIRKLLRPIMERKGKRNKERIIKEHNQNMKS